MLLFFKKKKKLLYRSGTYVGLSAFKTVKCFSSTFSLRPLCFGDGVVSYEPALFRRDCAKEKVLW